MVQWNSPAFNNFHFLTLKFYVTILYFFSNQLDTEPSGFDLYCMRKLLLIFCYFSRSDFYFGPTYFFSRTSNKLYFPLSPYLFSTPLWVLFFFFFISQPSFILHLPLPLYASLLLHGIWVCFFTVYALASSLFHWFIDLGLKVVVVAIVLFNSKYGIEFYECLTK